MILPASLRDDIHTARAVLAHHSDMTMGWDPVTGRLALTRYDQDTVDTARFFGWCAGQLDPVIAVRVSEKREATWAEYRPDSQ